MRKSTLLKTIPAILIVIIILPLFITGQALGWSSAAGNRTHRDIAQSAYRILSADSAFENVNFPQIQAIVDNDLVTVSTGGITGTGPDVVGSSNCGEHYYNPRLEAVQDQLAVPGAGGGVDAVETQFLKLVDALNSGDNNEAAHAASWLGHYIGDLNTPYHVQGTYRADIVRRYNNAGGANAASVPLPFYITGPMNLSGPLLGHSGNFKGEIEAFIAGTAGHETTEDWFDPWYWDGVGFDKLGSSHVVFEGLSFSVPGGWTSSLLDSGVTPVDVYSDLWENPTPTFKNPVGMQANKIREFAAKVARQTQQEVDTALFSVASMTSSPSSYINRSIASAATVWRASFTALAPTVTISVPDKSVPQKLKVVSTLANTSSDVAWNAELKLTITGGVVISGDTSISVGDVSYGYPRTFEWEVEASNLGYCTAKVEVVGEYRDTPDLQYAVAEQKMPGILPVTSGVASATRDHSIVFCLDNSGSMRGQPIIDAMNAGVRAVDAAKYAGVEMALYFFGVSGCDPAQRVVDFTVNRERVKAAIKTASARGDTPLADTIAIAGEYIRSSAQGEAATIILLTDGKETCGGDPLEAARSLNPSLRLKTSKSWFATPAYAASSDIPIKLQVVGFNLDSSTALYMEEVAEAGNGEYYSAANVEELTEALTTIVKEASQKGIQVQVWWLVVGGLVILFVIILLLRRRRTPVTAQATAGVSTKTAAPPQEVRPSSGPPPAAALFCPKCGSRIPAGAAFCTACGNSVAPVARPAPRPSEPSQAYCTKCGSPNASDSAFCGKCGSPLTTIDGSRTEDKKSQQASAFCPGCGAPVVPDSAYCNKCGSELALSVPHPGGRKVSAGNVTYCPQCGASNDHGSVFCNKCGASMAIQASGPAQVRQQSTAEPAMQVSPFWWILPFLFLLPGGVFAWSQLKDKNKKTARGMLLVSITWSLLILFSYLSNAF